MNPTNPKSLSFLLRLPNTTAKMATTSASIENIMPKPGMIKLVTIAKSENTHVKTPAINAKFAYR